MRHSLTFHGILFDRQPIRSLGETGALQFFGDGDTENGPSVVELRETEIVRWLLGHPDAKGLLYSQAQLDPTSRDFLWVSRPVIENANAKPGDVDWLCVSGAHPHLAVAFECKRIKVRVTGSGADHVNKIDDLGRGVVQANGLANMGFHRSYFMVIVQSDGRARRHLSQIYRGSMTETFASIYDFPQRESLDEDVGMMFVEVVQPTGRAIGEMAYVAVCVDRLARPREQSSGLTARVRQYLRLPR